MPPSLIAAQRLSDEGISATVVNARFAKPLDRVMITRLAKKHKYLVTVEEHVLSGGFGSAVLELLEEERVFSVPVKRIGIPDRFIEQGPQRILREQLGLTPEGIAQEVRAMVHERELRVMSNQ